MEKLRTKIYVDRACDETDRTLLEHVKFLGYFKQDGTFEVSLPASLSLQKNRADSEPWPDVD